MAGLVKCRTASPSDGAISPAIILRSVDFPHPEGPTIDKNFPAGISRLMSERARTFLPFSFRKSWDRFFNDMILVGIYVCFIKQRQPDKAVDYEDKEK